MQYAQQFRYTRSEVDRFAETHPRLDELGTAIEKELRFGFNLPTAYRRAELLHPTAGSATRAAQTRTPSAQTRPADRSIHGAPDGGPSTNGSRPRPGKTNSRRDATRAVKHAKGAL
jgi:hypothetical protein